jgi:hypothetical protein
VKIPVYLAVAQWALLLALGLLVIIMYRQLGRVFGQTKPGARHGPPVGSNAASFEYMRVGDDTMQYCAPGTGQAVLVAFVEPSCQACDRLVAAMSAAEHNGELAGLRVLLLTSEPKGYLQISDAFRSTELEIGRVTTRAVHEAYKVSDTPVLVAIDGAGVVRSAGPAVDLADVRAFSRACLLPAPDVTLPVVPAARANQAEPEAAAQAAGPE